jgi:pimeloyl-ACP methyl ester carboxylesterase
VRNTLRKSILALLLILVLLSNTTAAFALEKQATDSKGQYTVKDSRNYPIIFIPGMAGSTLDIGGAGNAWPGSLSTNDEAFKVLTLKDDGKNPANGPRVVATGTVRYGAGDVYNAGLGLLDLQMFPIYQGFYDYMEKQGYKLDVNPTGKVFFDFPYDFRQDNRNWTTLLDNKVNAVLKKTSADKVILVGHSMGGLQARLYMKDANRAKKVASVIFMGTPHQGSPMAFYAFTEGYNFGNSKLSDERMWEIAGNWAGGYQLLPSYPFIIDADDPAKGPVGLEAMLHENWISTQEYEQYKAAKKAGKKYTINKGFPNDKFASDSLVFHNQLGDSVDKYPGVKYYMIRGTDQKTVEYLVGKMTYIDGLPEGQLSFTKQMSPDKKGDGTVPQQGAEVKGLDGTFEVKAEHGAIPSNADAQKILTDLRKEANNEVYRQSMVDKVTALAGAKLTEFNKGTFSDKSWSLGEYLALLFLVGQPDEKKQELKKEIKDLAASIIKNCRVNITINAAPSEADKDPVEHLYLVIDNFKIKDSGTGIVSGANVNVTVNSYRIFEQVTRSASDASALSEAYKSGYITVKGGGMVNMLLAKLMEWYKKYM